jgi:predicted phosphodiesterase
VVERIAAGDTMVAAGMAAGLSRTFASARRTADPAFAARVEDAQQLARSGRKMPAAAATRTPADVKLETVERHRAELAQEKAAVSSLRMELRKAIAQHDSAKEIISVVRDHVERVVPIPLRREPPSKDLPVHEWVLNLSDWHIGQSTSFEETGGLYEQSTEIALKQVQTLWDVVSLVHQIESAGREIRVLHVLSLGDGVDGDLMRVSQARKVDRVVAEQYPILYGLMEALVSAALTRFDEVHVHVVGGNHDRFGKFGDAGLGELAYIDNWAFVMGTALEAAFAAEPRVTVENHQSFFGTTTVAGHKFAFSHGSDVNWRSNSYAGLPYYSLNVAAERMKAMVDGYDVLVMGHGHVPMVLPVGEDSRVVMNGSLPGTSTFVQSKYKSIRRPSQSFLSMHHRIGLTGYSPIFLDHEGMRTAEDMWEARVPATAQKFDLTK